MARKLKTYVTSMGFFDLAVAAPSMKAAMEAWGMKHNAFHRGQAGESDDPKIIAAATAKPGVVLRRPVGTREPFAEGAALPKDFSLPVAPRMPAPAKPKPNKTKSKSKAKPSSGADREAERAAIISFEKARAERERARAKERAREEEAARRDAEKRAGAVDRAQEALDEAKKDHEVRREKLLREQDELDRRLREEEARWKRERQKLESALDKAKRW